MARLEGVNVGALDPDSSDEFGQVGARQRARALIRHHAKMYPARLRRVLKLRFNRLRSENDVIDLDEVQDVVLGAMRADEQKIPKGFEIAGANVRGTDGSPLWLSYTYRVASGRVSKGAIPFTERNFPISYAQGEAAVQAARAAKGGLPADRLLQVLEQVARGGAAPASDGAAATDPELRATLEQATAALTEATAKIAEQGDRIAALEAGGGAAPASDGDGGEGDGDEPPASGDEPAGDGGEGESGLLQPQEPEEPWDGYEDATNAHDLVRKLKDSATADDEGITHRELAERVIDYEQAPSGKNRASLVRAANAILDSTRPDE